MTKMTAAARYRQVIASEESEIVDVTVPSGFTFKFIKPSKFGMLFGMGQLPTTAASQAVESWEADGVLTTNNGNGQGDQLKLVKTVMDLRDRVLKLSHSPKLVVGTADETRDELSTDDVSDEDLEYLFKWVSAGGDVSLMLATFPGGSQPSAVAQPNRKARRAAAK